jgi:hypothetical protein
VRSGTGLVAGTALFAKYVGDDRLGCPKYMIRE